MEDIDLAKFTQEEEAILRLTEEIWNRFFRITYQPSDGNG